MPVAVVGAIAAAGFSYATGATIFGLSVLESALIKGAVSFVISELSSALSPKPKTPSSAGNLSTQAQQRAQQITQAVGSSETVYGAVFKSGSVVYASNTQNNAYTHIVIVVADHEIAGIDEVWVNSDVVPNDYLDAHGNVTRGKYAGYLRIKKHLGGDGQTADDDLVAEDTAWTSAHRLQGRAYLYFRYKRNSTIFPSSPNFAALIRGKRLFDSRAGMNAWSPNVALIGNDWLADDKFGIGVASIGDDENQAGANACEEMVDTQAIAMTVSAIDTATDILSVAGSGTDSLLHFQHGDRVRLSTTGSAPGGLAVLTDYYVIPYQYAGGARIKLAASLDDSLANDGAGNAIDITSAGSGTHTLTKTGEPRYCGGGVISSDRTGGSALADILSAMAGRPTYTGGACRLYAGVWRGPTETIDEDDLRGVINVQTATTIANSFNTVIGTYISPLNNWQAADYPQVQGAAYVAEDLGEIVQTQIDLPFTQRASTAQRIATLKLNIARREIVVTAPCKLTALQFQPVDTLYLNNTRCGFSSKIFEVQSWKLGFSSSGGDAAPVPGIDMVLKETDSACYDWDSSGEIAVSPTPETTLPNPFIVGQVVGLGVNSIAVTTKGGDTTYRAVATWEPIANGFVADGGSVNFKYRLTGSEIWNYVGSVPGGATQADIFSGALGVGYDLAVWLINSLGMGNESDAVVLHGLSLGSAGGVGATIDWGNWTDAVGPANDWGNFTDAVGTSNDWGGFA